MTNLNLDPFTRTTSPGLGTEPLSGQAWQYSGANTNYSTTGATARIALAAVGTLLYATVETGKADHTARITFPALPVPTGGAVTLRIPVRYLDSSNYYEAVLTIPTAGSVTLGISKRIGGAGSSVATAVNVGTHAAGNSWVVVCSVFGTTIRARAWNTSGADPATWSVSGAAVDTAIQSATQAGWGARRETGSTNNTTVDGDNYQANTIIQVDEQAVYPPRVLITVVDLQVGDIVSVYRSVAGVRTLVQGGTVTMTDVALLRIDASLPFGVPVTYVAAINGSETSSPAVAHTLPGGKVVVSDAIAALAAEVVIWAWPEKAYDRSSTVYRVGSRNVVVSGDLSQSEGDVELYVDATSSAENLRDVLADCTQGIIQIRQPGGYDGVDGFYVLTDIRERRFSQDGSDEKRIFACHAVEVDGWAAAFTALGFTYGDLAAVYAGLTYSNLAADFATYLALGQADLS
jgi:hypothetical protein